MNKSIGLLFFGLLASVGCSGSSPAQPITDQPQAPTPDVQTVVAGNNQFAFDLFQKLREQDGNLFYSPYSISAALAMTYGGARTETAEEMAKVLHFTLAQEKLHAAMGSLQVSLGTAGKNRPYQLNIANALWGQKNYGFLPDFITLTKKNYGAGLNEVDFGEPEVARKIINDWVEKQTQEKIKNLIPKGELNDRVRLVLTNAIHFKGDWAFKFDKKMTISLPFHMNGGNTVNVPTMQQSGKFKYYEDEKVQVLELPYSGKELSMILLLPQALDGLAVLEKTLTAESVQKLLGEMREHELEVALPKFKMTWEFKLNDKLSEMGMNLAFAPGQADFSGMTGSRRLFISAVLHKAFVDVAEEGTEAAAATAVIMSDVSGRLAPGFRADRPFLFLIRDNQTGAVLFLGRVADPRNQ